MRSNWIRENSSIKQRILSWWTYKICAVRKSSGTAVSFPRADSTNQAMRTPRFLVESELVISQKALRVIGLKAFAYAAGLLGLISIHG